MRALLSHPDTAVLGAAAALLAAAFATGLLIPPLFTLLLAASVAAGVAFLALCFPVAFCVVWLMVTGMSVEMAFADILGDELYPRIIAIMKGIEIGLGTLCILRYGLKLDPLCPAWAFVAMLAIGLIHGLYPGLTPTDSLRPRVIGSVTPFHVLLLPRPPRLGSTPSSAPSNGPPSSPWLACFPFAVAGSSLTSWTAAAARLAGLGHPGLSRLMSACPPSTPA